MADVDTPSAAVSAMATEWPMIDALVGGTATMRAANKAFLPKFPKEDEESYTARLKCSVLFPAFTYTTEVMAAKPFARPLTVDEKTIPAKVRPWLSDVDMFGTALQPFAASLMLACLQKGFVGVLVDAPPAKGVKTVADERAAGVRPYMTQYPAESILGFRAVRDAASSHLTQLRLMEEVTEPDGPWGDKIVKQVRVLEPGKWEIYRKQAADGVKTEGWVLHEAGSTSLNKIPFVFFYGFRKGFGIGAPPLLNLAYMNVEHWQSASDQANILHVARVPILFAKGFNESDTITVGASSAAISNNKDADLKFVEHTGAAIEAGRESLMDLEDRMRQIGAELLVQQPATATATQVQTESEGGRSKLQKITEDFDESLEQCVQLMGDWINEPSDPDIKTFKDFGAGNLSQKSGDLLLRAAKDGHVSSETTFGALQRMDVVPNDIAFADEKLRLAQQAPKQQDDPKQPKQPANTDA